MFTKPARLTARQPRLTGNVLGHFMAVVPGYYKHMELIQKLYISNHLAFIGNSLYYVVTWFKTNRVTVYSTKCPGIFTDSLFPL